MKSNLLILLIFFAQELSAQSFTEVMDTPFQEVIRSEVAFADIDGDGDDDLLITGRNSVENRDWGDIAFLYTNQDGNFTYVSESDIWGVELGAIDFADIDGDNDLDLLITGNQDGPISRLYTNQNGNFTYQAENPIANVSGGDVAFADIDGDGDQDLLISGFSGTMVEASPIYISKLYTNEDGVFTEFDDTPFEAVGNGSSIAFSDVDGDNDLDVLLTGKDNSNTRVSKLYANDGGVFTELIGTPFEGVDKSSIAFSDVNGDNQPDVIITGINNSDIPISKLYINDGGNFNEVIDTPFLGVSSGSVTFADVDNDNDPDVLITGAQNVLSSISKLYINNGGSFSEVADTPFDSVRESSIAFSDIDGDDDQDLIITGKTSFPIAAISKLYINDGVISSIKNKKEDLQFEFSLFPNPSLSDEINIYFSSTENGLLTTRIIDINGRKLIQQQNQQIRIGEQTLLVDVSQLTSGIYFLEISDSGRTGIRKFVVQ